MKKSIFCLLISALTLLSFSSCSKDSEGLTKITTYAVIDLEGGSIITVNKGSEFVDPGYTAIQGTEDVTANVTVSGKVNTAECGAYKLNYRVVNPDGFAATAQRTVVVVDPSNFASAYLSHVKYGKREFFNLVVLITDNGDGTYAIDDLCGGFYSQGRYPGYPYDFNYEETLKLDDNGIVTLANGMANEGPWYFGDPIDVVDGKYDRATGTFTYKAAFAGDPEDAISVELTK